MLEGLQEKFSFLSIDEVYIASLSERLKDSAGLIRGKKTPQVQVETIRMKTGMIDSICCDFLRHSK